MKKITVIIADDHKMVREGIKQLLELEGDISIIGQANNGMECMELVKKLNPDVLLLDINMPDMSGLQVLEYIRDKSNKQKVLLLTIHNEIEYLVKAKEYGANGYILKDSDSNELRKAIIAVHNNMTYIEPSMVLQYKERNQEKRNTDVLTRREIEVLKLLAEGLFNKEVAYKLKISEKTVKNHVSSIFKKIDVSDRTQAAVYAIRNNMVSIR